MRCLAFAAHATKRSTVASSLARVSTTSSAFAKGQWAQS
jgi:hypothetical protein